MKSVIIIGAGLGGIAAAIRLAKRGYSVKVLEKQPTPGGRSNVITRGGYRVDTGPTILLMKHVFSDLYREIGENFEERLQIKRLDPNYCLYFHDGTRLDLHVDKQNLVQALETIEKGAGQAYIRYMNFAHQQYDVAMKYIDRNYNSVLDLVSLETVAELLRLKIHKSLYSHAAQFFRDERLKKAFTFHSLFLGLSPFEAMAFYSLITYSDLHLGMWYPTGGIYSIVEDMVRLAGQLGVEFSYSMPVAKIKTKNNRVTGVLLANGEFHESDIVISNADLPYTYQNLLDEEYQDNWGQGHGSSMKYACSGYLLYMGLDRTYSNLRHQSLYFSDDYSANIDSIFRYKRIPQSPSFHLSVPSVTDNTVAPLGHSTFYVLVPVPNLDAKIDWSTAVPQLRHQTIDQLEVLTESNIRDHIVWFEEYSPIDFREKYNAVRGTAFGSLSQNFFQTAAFRPSNRHRDVKGLYFVGQGTYPGIGMPLVLISAQLVVQRICEDLGAGVRP